MEHKDTDIEKLQKKIRKLEAALKIVTTYSGKAESRMRKQFEVVSETIPVPMIISNENGEIIFANLSAQTTFGYSAEDFSQIDVSSLYNSSDERKTFMENLSDKGEVSNFRVELKKSGESLFPAVIFAKKIDFDGHNAILNVVHDITEIMALEKQLRQTQKMESIGTLASGIAHDFNNILAAIFGYTELTKTVVDLEKNRKAGGYLDKIEQAVNRAKSMIMQMMAFCRQSEKAQKVFHINSIVSEVVKMMSDLTPSDIDIRSDISNRELLIKGDPTQIHQVVTNLITNSVHALSGKGGTIDVILKKADIVKEQQGTIVLTPPEPGVYAEVTVKDNGPGIDNTIIHNIFDPFFTTKPMGQGSGMGLAVVHGIIRGHKGSVSVESEPEKGAAFHCYFPVIKEKEKNSEHYVALKDAGTGDERILIVDDEPMILEVCSEALGSMGYNVTACEESRKALEILKTQPEEFDLIITDNTMPDMSGTELSKEIRKILPYIPIILITGNLLIRNSDLEKAGIQTSLQKPFDIIELQSVVRNVLDGAVNVKKS